MATHVGKVTEASKSLRISKQGRYLNTIADFCSAKYEWDFAKTVAILENGIVEGSTMTTIKGLISPFLEVVIWTYFQS